MHVRLREGARRRMGLIFAILAVMILAFFAFAGLCVDLGVIALTRSQLQTVADSAALAGAKQLNDPRRVSATFDLTADITSARQEAIAYAKLNLVLGQPGVVLDNPSNNPNGDVVVGFKDTTVKNSPLVLNPPAQTPINSVQVTARRDAGHTALVPSFFSKALGFSDTPLSITSTATVQPYSVLGFKTTPSGMRTTLIPIALSQTTWNAMLGGLTTDTFTYNPPNTASSGSDGIYESSLYPAGSGAGNWGTVNIGTSNNGTSALANVISNGVSTSDLASSGAASGGYFTLNPTIKLTGNPGVSLGIKSALQSLIGKTVVVPIYDPNQSSGNGGNFTYTILGFAPVVVLNTYFNGVHTGVTVQPALLSTDPNIVVGSPQPWTSGGVVRLRLTQ